MSAESSDIAESTDPNIGRVFGQRYMVERPIARGVASSVYEARDVMTRRLVAIKVLATGASDRARTRMLNEARTIARLTHRHIVRLEDLGVDHDGSPYIVQELIEGATLADAIEARGFFSLEGAMAVLTPILDALAHAHDHGIVHRDVKPANIVLASTATDDALPVLIDFGIAGALDGDALTRAAILGTPPYMAPEQVTDPSRVDRRADVWGLAMTLHEALTGALPLAASSPSDFAREIDGFESWDAGFLPGAPPMVRAALARALRVSVTERTPSVPELARDLDEALAASRASANTPTRAPPPRAATAPAPPSLSLALVVSAGDIDPVRIQDQLRALTGTGSRVLRMQSYEELVEALARDEVDLAWLPPVACAHALAQGAGEVVVALDRARGHGYRCALLGRSDLVRGYADLEGRRAVWVDRWSAAGYLVPRAMIRRHAMDPDLVLSSQTFVESHAAVLDALRAGTADIGGTFCSSASDARLPGPESGVSIIDVSDAIPPDVLCASTRLATARLDETRGLLLDPLASHSLASALGAASFQQPEPARYETLASALRA